MLDQKTIDALSDVLRDGPTASKIHDWLADDGLRRAATAGLVLGTIRWRKSLGKPAAPTMASGFEIGHYFWYEQTVFEGGVYRREGWWWGPFNKVSLWGLPDEGDEHRVGFGCTALRGSVVGANKITVALSPNHHWDMPPTHAPGQVNVSPPERQFQYKESFMVLEDFQVVWHRNR